MPASRVPRPNKLSSRLSEHTKACSHSYFWCTGQGNDLHVMHMPKRKMLQPTVLAQHLLLLSTVQQPAPASAKRTMHHMILIQ
jgi:hypothetical protein